MTTASTERHNPTRGREWRAEVTLFLHENGFESARARRLLTDVTKADRERLDRGDIENLPGWVVTTRSSLKNDQSTSLNQAQRIATAVGIDLCATIRPRTGYGVADAFVVMTLANFCRVMQHYDT